MQDRLGTKQIQRIRWKQLAILGGVLAVIAVAYLFWGSFTSGSVRDSALAQAAEARKKGDVDLALRHLDRYLEDNQDDIQALEVKAKILSEVELPQLHLLDAASSLDHLIRLDPNGKGRLETRRKLAEFYIRYSDELKRFADRSSDPDDAERKQSRYAAAAEVARQLVDDAVKGNYPDPVAHRLLARAYEGQISGNRIKFVPKNDSSKAGANSKDKVAEDLRARAIQNYQTAIELDPKDLISSARLAELYVKWSEDQFSADAVLDAMLKANPDSVDARLIRYRAFTSNREQLTQEEIKARDALATAEAAAILVLAPDNVDVRLNFARAALSRRDTAEARRQLDVIPAARQNDLQVKILRGYMEFAEQHPDDAIDQWRSGLMLVGGTNLDLTWKLAYNLVSLGRYAEAEPLREQYRRLTKGDKNGLGTFLDALFDMGKGKLYDARKKLEKIKDVVSRDTYKVDVLLMLGRCCEMMGDSDAALLAYRNAAASSPAAASPRLAIARHLQKRHPNDAIAEVDQALAESPKEPSILLEAIRLRLFGMALRSQADPRRMTEVEALLARLEAAAPNNPSLPLYRAEFLSVSGKLDKAMESLTLAVQGPARRQPEVWINLAQGLERLNRWNESIQTLDKAALPENAGDRVQVRIAKARLLARAGKGQAALEVLTKDPERVSVGERPELAKFRGELLRELGDRDGAIAAFANWAELDPKVPGPALALLAMAQSDNDDQAAKLGLAALKSIGGDKEPYGIAAEVFSLLRPDPSRPGPPPQNRIHDADVLVKTLQREVPSLRIGYLLQGMVLEYKNDLQGAAKAYLTALKDDVISAALPKLIEVLIKLKRFDDLTSLKRDFDREVEARQQPGLSTEFDRIATTVSLKLGDKDRADYYAARLIEDRRDNVSARTAYALLLDRNNEPEQAENSLKDLVREKPNDPIGWLTLIQHQASRKTPADVARTIEEAGRKYKGIRPDLFIAKCYWVGKDLQKAQEAFNKTLALHPDDLSTIKSLVEFYENTNQGDAMEPLLRKALKLDPSAVWAARLLAISLSIRPDPAIWPEAWALVAPGSSTSGETPEDRFIRATILVRSPDVSRREEAIQSFLGLANDLPVSSPLGIDTRLKLSQTMIDVGRFAQAWEAVRPVADNQALPNQLALILAIEALSRSKQPEEAQRRLDRLTVLDAKSPHVALSQAWVMLARGQKDQAVAALEAAYRGSSNAPNAEAIGMLALDRMIRFGDTETSLRVAKEVADRWPAGSWALASVHLLRKEYDQALAAAEKGVEAGSPRESLRYAVGAALKRQDDSAFLHKVTELAIRARKKDPSDYNIRVFLASLYHLQNRYEEELACYREALELYPSNVKFLNNMAWTLSEGLHKPAEALKFIQEAIQREGEHPQHLDTRGVIEERLGQYDLAIADLEKSAKADPLAATYFHLARLYWKAKNPAESRRYRELAIKAKFDPTTLDPTDRTDLEMVMGTP
jgi:tetratricopeptide (TPR) repeat protein